MLQGDFPAGEDLKPATDLTRILPIRRPGNERSDRFRPDFVNYLAQDIQVQTIVFEGEDELVERVVAGVVFTDEMVLDRPVRPFPGGAVGSQKRTVPQRTGFEPEVAAEPCVSEGRHRQSVQKRGKMCGGGSFRGKTLKSMEKHPE